MSRFLLTYSGDDFTGSTDVMEALTLGGCPTVLFYEPPTPERLARFPEARAIGIAGVSRSMSPEAMERNLPPIFAHLAEYGAPVNHYKICSTFDSSPQIGSIGKAIDLAWDAFRPAWSPMVVGAPILKRYVVFGNLFATVGDETFRLDRHLTMSRHPSTPMHEADIRLHLGQQTMRPIGHVDCLAIDRGEAGPTARARREAGAEIVLFDTLTDRHLAAIGEVVWEEGGFSASSSGLNYGLAMHWQKIGLVEANDEPRRGLGPVEQTAVVSGSCAPPTAVQIEWAVANGFVGIRLDVPQLLDPETADRARGRALEGALKAIRKGRSPLVYSAVGPNDPAIDAARSKLDALEIVRREMGERLGIQEGLLMREILLNSDLRRVVVCGGDTCGHASKQLGLVALRLGTPIAPGAPICVASSDDSRMDGLEISLKAGQVGKPNYFESILHGQA